MVRDKTIKDIADIIVVEIKNGYTNNSELDISIIENKIINKIYNIDNYDFVLNESLNRQSREDNIINNKINI